MDSKNEQIIRELVAIIDMQSRMIQVLTEEDAAKEAGYFDACAKMMNIMMLRACIEMKKNGQSGFSEMLTTSWLQTSQCVEDFAKRRDMLDKAVWKIWNDAANGESAP